jgi:hypothetical protein
MSKWKALAIAGAAIGVGGIKELGIDPERTFIYILGFRSREEREKRLKGRASEARRFR